MYGLEGAAIAARRSRDPRLRASSNAGIFFESWSPSRRARNVDRVDAHLSQRSMGRGASERKGSSTRQCRPADA